MTVLTFPSNPTLGQRYNAPNQIQYVYDGVKWIVETVASTSAAVDNSVQDRVAPMFVDGDHDGISFTYNAATNVLSASITAVNGDSLVNGLNEITLEADGTISLPTKTVASHDGYETTNPTLAIGTLGSDTIITQPAYDVNNRGDKTIRIQGQRGFGTWSTTGNGGWGGSISIAGGQGGETGNTGLYTGGEGGNIYATGGNGQAGRDGGDINLRGGDAVESGGSTNEVWGGNFYIKAGDANVNITPDKGYGGNLSIIAGIGNFQNGQVTIGTSNTHYWNFRPDGALENSGSWTKITQTSISSNVASQVVWTSTATNISGAKLTIQVEIDETGGNDTWETQLCEAIVAVRGYAPTSIPVMSVYGVTHTSASPLMTFTIDRNPTTSLIEITATRTGTASPTGFANLRIHSVEVETGITD